MPMAYTAAPPRISQCSQQPVTACMMYPPAEPSRSSRKSSRKLSSSGAQSSDEEGGGSYGSESSRSLPCQASQLYADVMRLSSKTCSTARSIPRPGVSQNNVPPSLDASKQVGSWFRIGNTTTTRSRDTSWFHRLATVAPMAVLAQP